ncbi:bifunctional diaminohydroxyphosphoribosylaminopyrimidine deaminase/5-amino-6-(5-phosphoribosylamino)uracil reductase RibD [Fusobacterium sp. PH5-44]|uniref:bifunctional diaminohydroxyphosphoribosylaminopyrimidine deaminase/5-amino-6-(5-phosphoribosylamino)uracil reductase RibD n=1 Tax=unclassified Fusobacterium TaxID=2648384 RepID=UPI003D1C9C75
MDNIYMKEAMKLSLLGEGHVNPNPYVGAVVVKDGKIIGKGYHKEHGGPHAEVFALEEAGENAKGATIYVTLEPCSHYGKTPPCAKKIVEMGIKKCIISCLDPNPLVSGNGVKYLKENGVEVITGVLEKEGLEINRVFFKYIVSKIPFLFLKCAITLDGKIATHTGNSKWITNELAREKVQKLRNKYSGIMIGVNTLLADNPSLTARIKNGRNPYRIVVDPHLKVDLDSKFVNFTDEKSILITSKNNFNNNSNNLKINILEEKKVKIIYLDNYNFKISDILSKLGELAIDSVLLEGGSYLISKAFEEDVIDGGEIFIAPKILGDEHAIPFVKGFNRNNISEAIQLENIKTNLYNNNISFEFYK